MPFSFFNLKLSMRRCPFFHMMTVIDNACQLVFTQISEFYQVDLLIFVCLRKVCIDYYFFLNLLIELCTNTYKSSDNLLPSLVYLFFIIVCQHFIRINYCSDILIKIVERMVSKCHLFTELSFLKLFPFNLVVCMNECIFLWLN